jgi:hypothetical protein
MAERAFPRDGTAAEMPPDRAKKPMGISKIQEVVVLEDQGKRRRRREARAEETSGFRLRLIRAYTYVKRDE